MWPPEVSTLMVLNVFSTSTLQKTAKHMCIEADEQRAPVPAVQLCVLLTNHNEKRSNIYNAKLGLMFKSWTQIWTHLETFDLSAGNHKKQVAIIGVQHAHKVAKARGVKTEATVVTANANPKTKTAGNVTDSTKKPEQTASRVVKVSPRVKANLAAKGSPGKENLLPARRANPRALNAATVTRNPNKTPTAKKLPSNAAVKTKLVDGAS